MKCDEQRPCPIPMSDKLFRQEAIDAGRARLTGTVVAATPPGTKLYTSLIAVVVAAAFGFLLFGEYATRVEVQGLLTDRSGVSEISAPAPATIREVHVKEGQIVRKGDPLVTISLSDGSDASGEGLSGQLAKLDRQDEELARQETLATTLGETELQALRQRKNSLSASIRSMSSQISLIDRQVALARDNVGRAKRLASRGAGTKQQLEEARSEMLTRELDRETIRERLANQRGELSATDSEIKVREINLQQSRSQLSERRAALGEQRSEMARRDSLTLTASKTGRVADIAAKLGMQVKPGRDLVSIVPDNRKLEVNLYAPTRSIGFVKPGQVARLQFDAFPFQKYGTASGVVTWVSEVPTTPTGIANEANNQVPMYRVRVQMDSQTFKTKTGQYELKPGMTVSANLVLENRQLWEVFFEPILRTMRS